MATRIRLRREGRKGQSYFRIVVADSRAPRDGRFVALLGHYNPRTNPADIKVDAERARAGGARGGPRGAPPPPARGAVRPPPAPRTPPPHPAEKEGGGGAGGAGPERGPLSGATPA